MLHGCHAFGNTRTGGGKGNLKRRGRSRIARIVDDDIIRSAVRIAQGDGEGVYIDGILCRISGDFGNIRGGVHRDGGRCLLCSGSRGRLNVANGNTAAGRENDMVGAVFHCFNAGDGHSAAAGDGDCTVVGPDVGKGQGIRLVDADSP